MMALEDLLSDLSTQQVTLRVEGGELRASGPKGTMTAERVEAIRAHKSDLLDLFGQSYTPYTPIPTAPRSAPLPLSFGQQRLWFLEQLTGETSLYALPFALRLRGNLCRESMRRALNTVVERHESLRTTFPMVNGSPVQHVAPPPENILAFESWRDMNPNEWDAAITARAATEAHFSFNTATGPLLRMTLIELAEQDHLLFVTVHHTVFDGWSLRIFIQEVEGLYAAYRAGRTPSLPPLPVQYGDYAAWQRATLSPAVVAKEVRYWYRALAGVPTALDLPTDHPRPPMQTFAGASVPVAIPTAITQRLQQIGQAQGATLFMTLLSAWGVLLQRHSGQDDMVIGTPIANRSHPDTEGMIGFFVNTLALRLQLQGKPTFRELVRRVQNTALSAYAHQDVPFEKLVEELHIERDLGRSALFQVMFVLQNASGGSVRLGDLEIEHLDDLTTTAKFDLTLVLSEGEQGVKGYLEYNSDLFERDRMERLVAQFGTVLEAVAYGPDMPITRLPLLNHAEQHRILRDWNNTNAPYPQGVGMHGMFEAQAARTPDAIALVSDTEKWTYRRLNARANQVAHHLTEIGVGRGDLVAVLMDRTPIMIATLMGILKAGAAYVPLEMRFPPERMRLMLNTLGVTALIISQSTRRRAREVVPNVPSLRHVILADGNTPGITAKVYQWDQRAITSQQTHNPNLPIIGRDRAYIIFTSGSTGIPKGVQVCHDAACNLIEWVNRRFNVTAHDRLLFVTSLCFDLSVYDIFGILAAGGSVRVVREADITDPERLLSFLRDEPITFWDSAPAMLQQVTPFLPNAPLPNAALRLVFMSGDWIPVALPDQLRGVFPNANVISLGGATEATVWSNYYPIGAVDPTWSSIPYGVPIWNAAYYVLDAEYNPCPVGVAGDLYIAGLCLADGYANAPTLTATKFIPDPHSPIPGARMYHTGDRARFWADGTMEFLGRIDNQVKIRGYRIELGDIESVLRQCDGVAHCLVIAQGEARGAKQLVAYVVPNEGEKINTHTLRRTLQRHLPEYMVPSHFVPMDQIPISPNGKVDRKALPLPDGGGEGSIYAAPRSPLEQKIAALWAEVLQVARVGIQDIFFDIGGHSLLAIHLLNRIQEATGVKIPLATLYREPTVAGVSAYLESHQAQQSQPSLYATQPNGTATPWFGILGTGIVTTGFDAIANTLDSNTPFYTLYPYGADGNPLPFTTISDLATHYVNAIRQQQPNGPYQVVGHSYGGLVAYEIAQQLRANGEEVNVVVLDMVAPAFVGTAHSTTLSLDEMEMAGLVTAEDVATAQQGLDVDSRMRVSMNTYPNEARPYKGNVTVVMATTTSDTLPPTMRHLFEQPDYGWWSFVEGTMTLHRVVGDHNTILNANAAPIIAAILNNCTATVA